MLVRRSRERLVLGPGIGRAPHLERLGVGLLVRDIFGQLDVRRAGLLDPCETERLPHDLGHRVRDGDARAPLRDGLEHPDDVDVLVRFLMNPLESGLPGDRDQRRAIELGIGHAREQIRRAGSERREAHTGV